MIQGIFRHKNNHQRLVQVHGTRNNKRDGFPEYQQVRYSHCDEFSALQHMRATLFLSIFEKVEA